MKILSKVVDEVFKSHPKTVEDARTMKSCASKKKTEKVHVSLSKFYVDGIDELIKEGVYINRTEAVMSALRRLFKHYKLDVSKV